MEIIISKIFQLETFLKDSEIKLVCSTYGGMVGDHSHGSKVIVFWHSQDGQASTEFHMLVDNDTLFQHRYGALQKE